MKKKILRKITSVVTAMITVAVMAAPAVYAEEYSCSYSVDKGELFEEYVPCECGQDDQWIFQSTSGCITERSYDGSDNSVQFYAAKAGKDLVSFVCKGCGSTGEYSITVNDSSASDIQPISLYLSDDTLKLDLEGKGTTIQAYYDTSITAKQGVDLSWTITSGDSYIDLDASGRYATITPVKAGKAVVRVYDSISRSYDDCLIQVYNTNSYDINFTTSPVSSQYKVGQTPDALFAQAKVTASDGSSFTSGITYQWYSGTKYGNITNKISGANDQDYYPSTSSAGTTYYICVASYNGNGAGVSVYSNPVSISVVNDTCGIYLVANDTTLDAGGKTTVTAHVYSSSNSLYTGSVNIKWSTSSSGASFDDSTTTTKTGKSTNVFRTDTNTSTKNYTAYASVKINGVTYEDSITIKAYGVNDPYSISISSDATKLASGQTANLTASIYKNSSLYKLSNPSVEWSVINANNFAKISSSTTTAKNGKTENTLQALYSTNSTNTVTVKASVKLDGTTYTAYKDIIINSTSLTPTSTSTTTTDTSSASTIVMQINNRSIQAGGITITNDVAPVLYQSRTMVPIRVITELLGGTADWNGVTSTVTLSFPTKVLSMTVGQTIPGFDVSPVIMNGRTYVPVRYVSEAVGANVEWISSTNQIIITK